MPLSSEPGSLGKAIITKERDRRKKILKRTNAGEPIKPKYHQLYRNLKNRLFHNWKIEFTEQEKDYKAVNPKYRIREPNKTRKEFIRYVRKTKEYQETRMNFADLMSKWIIERAEWAEDQRSR